MAEPATPAMDLTGGAEQLSTQQVVDALGRDVDGVELAALLTPEHRVVAASTATSEQRAHDVVAAAADLAGAAAAVARAVGDVDGDLPDTVVEVGAGTLMVLGLGQGRCLVTLVSPLGNIDDVVDHMAGAVERLGL